MDLLCALGVAVLLTRLGFALYAAGLVRAKNSAGVVTRTLCGFCVTVLIFWAIGAAILVHLDNRVFAINASMLCFNWRADLPALNMSVLFFYLVMILTAAQIVNGAVAERSKFFPMLIATLVLSGFVLPVTAQWAWVGWLKLHGFVDFGGGAALHVTAGTFAAIATLFVGPRTGKFNRDGSSSMIPGHNLPQAAIGTVVTMVGWVAYAAGATLLVVSQPRGVLFAGAAAMHVLLATAAAGLGSTLLCQIRYGKPDILLTLTGLLGGMVSMCGAAAFLPTWAAVVTGLVTGIIVPLAVVTIDLRARLDDPLGVIAIHVVGGACGTLATGFFVPKIDSLTRLQRIGIQATGLITMILFSAMMGLIVFGILKKTIGLRVKEADEFDGLDLAEHDIGAYPDFQQNTIKSYHLREA